MVQQGRELLMTFCINNRVADNFLNFEYNKNTRKIAKPAIAVPIRAMTPLVSGQVPARNGICPSNIDSDYDLKMVSPFWAFFTIFLRLR